MSQHNGTIVLLPYEFTLLSNTSAGTSKTGKVLLPYEFTLLSNLTPASIIPPPVLLPYEFTLLSNNMGTGITWLFGFTTL